MLNRNSDEDDPYHELSPRSKEVAHARRDREINEILKTIAEIPKSNDEDSDDEHD